MHTLRNVVFQNIHHQQTTTILEHVTKERGQSPAQSSETEAMVSDLMEILQYRNQKTATATAQDIPERRHDVDRMSDEDMARINIRIDENDAPVLAEGAEKSGGETEAQFNEYKHHQFVRRWGLFKDLDGRDEEWFIPSPPVLPEDDAEYLCDMCRHIDFRVLFSQRGLPGNTQGISNSIELYGLAKVMEEGSCSFCSIIRRKIQEEDLLANVSETGLKAMSFKLKPLDDGPEYALRLEIEIPDVNGRTYRFVLQNISDETQKPFDGLAVEPGVADVSRLKGWLEHCEHSHDKPQAGLTVQTNTTTALRVIDTIDGCVREVDIPFQYACLSYVWGQGSQTQLTTATRVSLETPGGLTESSVNLPQTIKDALQVTQGAGLRYIWVDALCIIQDDDNDKGAIISKMGTIYGNAALTIVASTNSNPTEGLPGISIPRSLVQITGRVQGITLAVAFHDARRRYAEIESSPWNSRAWTFQERALSRKAVYFTSSQMYFQCPHGTVFEDTVAVPDAGYRHPSVNDHTDFTSRIHDLCMCVWSDPTQHRYPNKAFDTEGGTMIMIGEESDDGSLGAPLYKYKPVASRTSVDTPIIDGQTMWDMYAQAVTSYTTRKMSWQSDAVNAFLGITDLISQGINTKFWHAIPSFALARSLLWHPKEPLKRRAEGGKPLFPSWTWAAWEGALTYRGRGWHNAIRHEPSPVIAWLHEVTPEACIENFIAPGDKTDEEIAAFAKQVSQAETFLMEPSCHEVLHLDYRERGWEVHRDEARNKHFYTHDIYPGVKFDHPTWLPDQEVLELLGKDGTLYFKANLAPVRFCDMTATQPMQTPIQDTFFQIGLNDEKKSANYRPPWKRIIYHQGYRAGFLTLNIPFTSINLASGDYSVAAISRDTLPHIAPPPHGWEMYWAMEPQMVLHRMFREEWYPERYPPDAPDESATPFEQPQNENGDPRWDKERFGGVAHFDVYNVLLLKDMGRHWERVGVGKMSHCAFHCAKPSTVLVKLK